MAALNIRDRIVQFHRIPASMLRVNPENPRTHNDRERAAFAELLERVGFAGALLAYRDAEGALTLVDGQMRQEMLGDQDVPVLETDLSAEEARELMLFFDRISGMAEYDPTITLELVDSLDIENGALSRLAGEMADEAEISGLAADLDEVTAGGKSQPEGREKKTKREDMLPTPIKAVITVSELAIVEQALAATGEKNRGTALTMLARQYLSDTGHEIEE